MRRKCLVCILLFWPLLAFSAGSQTPAKVTTWLTTPDRASLLAQQPEKIKFRSAAGQTQTSLIAVDDTQSLQNVDGFGVAVTDGSARLLMAMNVAKRHALIRELFGTGKHDIGISYIRVTIGSSDMNKFVYSYDDMPAGQTDPNLSKFSLKPDEQTIIPVLKAILAVNPKIKILASPWSAPPWMKTNGKVKGGSLKPKYYKVYAHYLVHYLKGMKAHGISIDAITMQNEPLNPKNTPSMVMSSNEQDEFLKNDFGPLMQKQGIATKVIVFDHNCNHPDYPISILADPKASRYAVGSAFHLYEGVISAMSTVHDAFPHKNVYFTEQLVRDRPDAKKLAIATPEARVVIGAMRNWSRNVLLWNLAADPKFGPHTNNGGCPVCEGAVTLKGNTVKRNLSYYTIAHAAKFVRPGSVRIASTLSSPDQLANVAFRTPRGNYALIVANTSAKTRRFGIVFHGQEATMSLAAGAVATYLW